MVPVDIEGHRVPQFPKTRKGFNVLTADPLYKMLKALDEEPILTEQSKLKWAMMLERGCAVGSKE